MSLSTVGVSGMLLAVALVLQGCDIPFMGGGKLGEGACAQGYENGPSAKVDDLAACKELCTKSDGCTNYAYCAKDDTCKGNQNKGFCSVFKASKCELTTKGSWQGNGYVTYAMYDAEARPRNIAQSNSSPVMVGFVGGMVTMGAFVALAKRIRSSTQQGGVELSEELRDEEDAGIVDAHE